jgi:hypothetical protein
VKRIDIVAKTATAITVEIPRTAGSPGTRRESASFSEELCVEEEKRREYPKLCV